MRTQITKKAVVAVAGACLLALSANANPITYVTPTGSTSQGQAVDAYATFLFGSGSVTITLGNLEANPTAASQLISDLSFTLSDGASSGTLASMSSTEITIGSGGTVMNPTPVTSSRWHLSSSGFTLDALGGGQPSDLIIGPPDSNGLYSNANSSIGNFNPSLSQTATFVVDVANINADTSVTGATFSFGTGPDAYVTGQVGQPPQSVPDGGTTALLLGAALSAVGLIRRKLS